MRRWLGPFKKSNHPFPGLITLGRARQDSLPQGKKTATSQRAEEEASWVRGFPEKRALS